MTQDDGMTRHPLPNDVCRCVNETCNQRDTCRRWIDRDTGGPRTPHAWMNEIKLPKCTSYIPLN